MIKNFSSARSVDCSVVDVGDKTPHIITIDKKNPEQTRIYVFIKKDPALDYAKENNLSLPFFSKDVTA